MELICETHNWEQIIEWPSHRGGWSMSSQVQAMEESQYKCSCVDFGKYGKRFVHKIAIHEYYEGDLGLPT